MPSPESVYGGQQRKQPKLNANYSVLVDTMEALPGFSLITDCYGKILFVTPAIEKFFGYEDSEVIGLSLNDFLHLNDAAFVRDLINNASNQVFKGVKKLVRITFDCRWREKSQHRTDSLVYKTVRVSGHITAKFSKNTFISDDISTQNSFSASSPGTNDSLYSDQSNYSMFGDSPSTPTQSYSFSSQSIPETPGDLYQSDYCQPFLPPKPNPIPLRRNEPRPFSKIILLGFVEVSPANPKNELNLVDAPLDEYISRHSLDGTLIYADHRISSIIGFTPTEVYGKSAYDFIVPGDYSIALFAHKLMLSNSNGTGVVVHRLRSVNGTAVFLQTAGTLQYNSAGQIDHFICVSRMLFFCLPGHLALPAQPDIVKCRAVAYCFVYGAIKAAAGSGDRLVIYCREQDGEKERVSFVKRFMPHIHNQSPLDLYKSLQCIINPFSSGCSSNSSEASFSSSSAAIAIATASTPPSLHSKPTRQLPAWFARHSLSSVASLGSPSSMQASLDSNPSQQLNSPAVMDLVNQTTVQATIKHLEDNQEFLFARAQAHIRETDASMLQRTCAVKADNFLAYSPPPQMEYGTRRVSGSLSGSTTGLSSTEQPTNQFSDEIEVEDAVKIPMPDQYNQPPPPFSLSYVQPDTSKQMYKLAAGQRDYTSLLGARVLTFDSAQQATFSVYTPQEALDAQQRDTRLSDSATSSCQQLAASPLTVQPEPKDEEKEETYDCQYQQKQESQRKLSQSCVNQQDYQLHHPVYSQLPHHFVSQSSAFFDDQNDFNISPSTLTVGQQTSSSVKRASETTNANVDQNSYGRAGPSQQNYALPRSDLVPIQIDDDENEICTARAPLSADVIDSEDVKDEKDDTQMVPHSTEQQRFYKQQCGSTNSQRRHQSNHSFQMVTFNESPLSGISVEPATLTIAGDEKSAADELPDDSEANEIVLLEEGAIASVPEDQLKEHHHHHLPGSTSGVTLDSASAPLSMISTTTSPSVDISQIDIDRPDSGGLIGSSDELSFNLSSMPLNVQFPTSSSASNDHQHSGQITSRLPGDLKQVTPSRFSPPLLGLPSNTFDWSQQQNQTRRSCELTQMTPSLPLDNEAHQVINSTKKYYETYAMNEPGGEKHLMMESNNINTTAGDKSRLLSHRSERANSVFKPSSTESNDSNNYTSNTNFNYWQYSHDINQVHQQSANRDSNWHTGAGHISLLPQQFPGDPQFNDFDFVCPDDLFFSDATVDLDPANSFAEGGLNYARSASQTMYDYGRKDELMLPHDEPDDSIDFAVFTDQMVRELTSLSTERKENVSFLDNSKMLDQFNLDTI